MVKIEIPIKLLNDWVLVKRDPKKEETSSGIYLGDELYDERNSGEVLAIGHKVTEIKVGDKVHHGYFFGMELEYLGHECFLMRDTSIIVVK